MLATQPERVALNVQNGAVNLRGKRGPFSSSLSCSSSVWHGPAVRGDGSAVPGLCQSLQRTCSAWQWGRRRQRHGLHCSTLQHSQNKDLLGKQDLCCCCMLTAVQRQGPETTCALRIFPHVTVSRFPRGFAVNRTTELLIRH